MCFQNHQTFQPAGATRFVYIPSYLNLSPIRRRIPFFSPVALFFPSDFYPFRPFSTLCASCTIIGWSVHECLQPILEKCQEKKHHNRQHLCISTLHFHPVSPPPTRNSFEPFFFRLCSPKSSVFNDFTTRIISKPSFTFFGSGASLSLKSCDSVPAVGVPDLGLLCV